MGFGLADENDMKIENDDSARQIFEFTKHEDTLFQARTLIFITMQSLLYAGMVAATGLADLQVLFISMGLLSAFIWLLATWRQKSGTLNKLKRLLEEYGKRRKSSNFFRLYREILKSRSSVLGINDLIGYMVPIMFIVAWFAVLKYLKITPLAPS